MSSFASKAAKIAFKPAYPRNRCAVGTGNIFKPNDAIKYVPKKYHYMTDWWHCDVTSEEVKAEVDKFAPCLDIAEVTMKHNTYKAFMVTVVSKFDAKMFDPVNWQQNVRVRRILFPEKSNLPATSVAATTAALSSSNNPPHLMADSANGTI